MGWLAEAQNASGGGVWGMNDAGHDAGSGPELSRNARFQVSLTDPIPAGRPLPVQAFLSCAGDVVACIGTLACKPFRSCCLCRALKRRQARHRPRAL